ncbi:MAG: RDD family protein [Desulfobacterales bacterium]
MGASSSSDTLSYVGFWLRLWATIIDVIIITIVIAPLTFYIFGSTLAADLSATQDVDVIAIRLMEIMSSPLFFLISNILPLLAMVVLWRTKAATPGKMVFSARIVDSRTGGSLSTGQSIIRALAYMVSTIPFCLGYLWIAFDKRKQSWHDKIAHTVVVRPGASNGGSVRFQ